MDDILKKLNEKFDKRTYYDKYGLDVIISFILIFFVLLTVSYFHIMNNIQPIKADWDNQRCNPKILPFAGWIHQEEGKSKFDSSYSNFSFCLNGILKNIVYVFFKPVEKIFTNQTSIIEGLFGIFNGLYNTVISMKDTILQLFEQIIIVIINLISEITNLILQTNDALSKLQGILVTIFYTIINAFNFLISGLGVYSNITVLATNVFVALAMANLYLMIIWLPFCALPPFIGLAVVLINFTFFVLNILMIVLLTANGWGFLYPILSMVGVGGLYPGVPVNIDYFKEQQEKIDKKIKKFTKAAEAFNNMMKKAASKVVKEVGKAVNNSTKAVSKGAKKAGKKIKNVFCFDGNTKMETKQGIKYMKDLLPGDVLSDLSVVTSVMKSSSINTTMYNYKGVIVSSNHKVNYCGKFTKVKDIQDAIKINNYEEKYIYCINTNKKSFMINNNEFQDWDELDYIERDIVIQEGKKLGIFPENMLYEDIYLYTDTPVKNKIITKNNISKDINDIMIGDILSDGSEVLTIVNMFKGKHLMTCSGIITTENGIIADYNYIINLLLDPSLSMI